MVDKVMERSPAQPEKPAQDPFDIALRMIQLVPKPSPVPDPMDQALRLMEFVRANQQSQAVDPLAAYAKVAEVIETRASRQTANPGGGTDWGALILGFLNALPQMMQGFMMMRATAPPPPAGNSSQPNPSVPIALGPIDPTGAPMPPDLNTLFSDLKPFLLKAIVQGQAGDEFASGLVTFQGEERYRQLASYGMDGLMGALKSNAELWMMLSSHEDQVRAFIQDFLDYGKEEPAALEGAVE